MSNLEQTLILSIGLTIISISIAKFYYWLKWRRFIRQRTRSRAKHQ
jgi:hypothetical protein